MRSFRFSIAGLMGLVLLAAIAAAGVAHPKGPWVGMISHLRDAMICLAVVGEICRSGAERVWWLGFASFGWMFRGNAYWYWNPQRYPEQVFLTWLGPLIGIPIDTNNSGDNDRELAQAFFEVGHCLWTVVAAVIGGFLASALFGAGPAMPDASAGAARPPTQRRPLWWVRPSAIFLAGLSLVTSIAVICAPLEPGIRAGATFLLTWLLLGLTAFGSVFASRRRREFWLGATFLGVGFMLLIFSRPYNFDPGDRHKFLPTVKFVEAIRPRVEVLVDGLTANPDNVAKNARIQSALMLPVPMHFPDKTTLDEFLHYVKQMTRSPDGTDIPIYVDPIGLQEAEKSMSSTLTAMNFEGVALRTSLRLALRQLDLAFVVQDGLLMITSSESEDLYALPYNDPFQIVAHCLLALIMAWIGGVAAPMVSDLARGRREQNAGG